MTSQNPKLKKYKLKMTNLCYHKCNTLFDVCIILCYNVLMYLEEEFRMSDNRFKKGLIGRFISRLFHKRQKAVSNTEFENPMRIIAASKPSRIKKQGEHRYGDYIDSPNGKVPTYSKERRCYGGYINGPFGEKIPTEVMLPKYQDPNLIPSVRMEKKKNREIER